MQTFSMIVVIILIIYIIHSGFFDTNNFLEILLMGMMILIAIMKAEVVVGGLIVILIVLGIVKLTKHIGNKMTTYNENDLYIDKTPDNDIETFRHVNRIVEETPLFIPDIIERDRLENSELQYVAISSDALFHYSIISGDFELKKRIMFHDIESCQLVQEDSSILTSINSRMQSNVDRIYIKIILKNDKEIYEINILNHTISRTDPDYRLYDDAARSIYDKIFNVK